MSEENKNYNNKNFMDKMENQHKTEMNELREKFNKIEQKKVGGINQRFSEA